MSVAYINLSVPSLVLFDTDLSLAGYWRWPRFQERVVVMVVGRPGWGGWGGGVEKALYRTSHCHHQNDFWIKVGSDESRFNVSLIERGKVSFKSFHEPQLCEAKENPKPSFCRPKALPLGQTGSFTFKIWYLSILKELASQNKFRPECVYTFIKIKYAR